MAAPIGVSGMAKKATKKQVRSDDPAQLSPRSRARHFRLKVVECLQQADIAKRPETRETFKKLALSYEKLASHAESIARKATLGRRKKSD